MSYRRREDVGRINRFIRSPNRLLRIRLFAVIEEVCVHKGYLSPAQEGTQEVSDSEINDGNVGEFRILDLLSFDREDEVTRS